MDFLKQHAKPFVLLLVLLAGIIITAPFANYQDYLSQGDHGRDLYAAQAVFRGELPYKDFWWVYGPLTPYYYGLFFKVFGVKITSMILGKIILRILGGILVALAMMQAASPLAALFCACWFMIFQQDFFFTYNHLAGIVMMLGVVFCLFTYINKGSQRSAWGALGFVFTLCLIKINFGLAALVVSLISICICDFTRGITSTSHKKTFYAAALIGLPLAVFMIYYSLLKGLSVMEIRQCLPYMEGDQPYSTSVWDAVSTFLNITWRGISSNWENLTFAVIINASALCCAYLLFKNRLPPARRKLFILSLSLLVLFYIANAHEYLKSGVWYRIFWAQPLSIMMIFLLIDTATQSTKTLLRKIVFTFIAGLGIFCSFSISTQVNSVKVEGQYVDLPKGGIYITNAHAWISTVEETTNYLNNALKGNELFFALPYDCLYYYLTGKRTPTRQLIFFEHIKIPMEQERSVIADLERNHVNYIVLSSRAFARQELGLGFLGNTYCPLIGKYIQENFRPVARFGDWRNEPGWAWNHGTLILKRKG